MHTFDDSPGFREQRSTLVTKIAERFAEEGILNSPESRLEYFDQLGVDGFIKLLADTDRILTKQHAGTPFVSENYNYIVDELNPEATFEIMPAPEDKLPLLARLYEKSRVIPYDSPEAIDRIAAFVGFGINAIHPFTDGNGRTARTIYTLLSANDADREPLLRRAASEVDIGQLYLNPSTFRNPLMEFIQERLPTHHRVNGELIPYVQPALTSRMALSGIRPQNRPSKRDTSQLLEAVFHDRHISTMVPTLLIKGTKLDCAHEIIGNHNGQPYFDIVAFAKTASKKDISLLRSAYRAITNEYTLLLMDVMSGSADFIERTVVPSKEYGPCAIPPLSLITRLAQGSLHLDMEGYGTINEKATNGDFVILD